jgi:hypothetical protein
MIESDASGHHLSVDGKPTGVFSTQSAAEGQALKIARRFAPTATLKFELDFAWTLSDLEIRMATLEVHADTAHGEVVCG